MGIMERSENYSVNLVRTNPLELHVQHSSGKLEEGVYKRSFWKPPLRTRIVHAEPIEGR